MKQQINISVAPLMVKGLAADFHVEQYTIKSNKVPFDAGFDLYPASTEPETEMMDNGCLITVDTCLHVCIPVGCVGLIAERSSSMTKLHCARIKPGVIDSGYTGEIKIQVVCLAGHMRVTVDRIKGYATSKVAIAQMLVMPVHKPAFAVWDDKKVPPGRGANGFGHSDIFIQR
jgi:dUTPase